MSVIADTNTNSNEIFVPYVKYKTLCGTSKETETNLLVAKKTFFGIFNFIPFLKRIN